MKKIKQTLLTGMLASACAMSAGAMEAIQDEELSNVTGQDGLTVIADLHINIASVEYGDSTKGTSLALEDIQIDGIGGFMLDVITGDEFIAGGLAAVTAYGLAPADAAAIFADVGLQAGYQLGSDVIQISGPFIDVERYPEVSNLTPSVSVASISTGNGGASLGSLAVNGINPMGSKIWMFGHD